MHIPEKPEAANPAQQVLDVAARIQTEPLLADNLRPATALLGLYYALLCMAHWLLLPPAIKAPLMLTAGITAGLLLLSAALQLHWRIPDRWAHATAAGIALIAIINSLLHLYLAQEPQQTTTLMLVIIAAGFIFLSTRWFAAIVGITLAGWGVIALLQADLPDRQHFGFALFSAAIIAILVHIMRRRSLEHLAALRRQDKEQQLSLAAALASTQAAQQALETLGEAAHAVGSTLSLAQLLDVVLEQLAHVIPYDSATIYLLADDRLEPQLHHARHATTETPPPVPLQNECLISETLRLKKPRYVEDITRQPDSGLTCLPPELRSWVGIPLLTAGEAVGLLVLGSDQVAAYTEQDVQRMSAFADYAAAAFRNVSLATRTRNTLTRLSFLYAAAQTLTTTLDTGAILKMLMDLPHQHFQPDAVSVATVESDGSLVFRAASGEAADQIIGLRLPPGTGVMGWVAEHGKPLWIPNVQEDRRFYHGVDDETGFITHAIYAVPVMVGEQPIAVLEMINPAPETPIEEAQDLLTALAALAAPAIHNANLFAQVQRTEARYQGLFEQNLDPIVILDDDGILLDANRAARQRLLLPPAGTLCLKPLQIAAEDFAAYREQLSNGEPISWEARYHDTTLQIQLSQIHHYAPDLTAYQWLAHDITDRVALEETREQLSHMIVHDLRNPLGSILNSIELIRAAWQEKDITMPIEQLLAIGNRNAQRMDQLISTILDTARLEAGEKTLHIESITISALIQEITEAIQPTLAHRRQTLLQQVEADLPPMWGDQDLLRRVLANLLDNAIKFTPTTGEVTLTVAHNGKGYDFIISDNGPGISPEEQDRIFQPFVRGHHPDTKNIRGAGLGLAFCKLAVEAHGGQIWVESEPGNGTTFKFTIPHPLPTHVLRQSEAL